ncbi:NosD domain-containing protein [Hoeflea sp.]|uniref:right-handed parallel beta-helix repeat-containing protein n=1 Tax=Hoeflea sp. TaxID=1940281 RepID=UPI001984A42B|nr:NosD domain-containing protein [Hoeflea sp.]MBC7283760.1 right-handed parallel beta-helix repeat-containing protein [Hoeflea sp.]
MDTDGLSRKLIFLTVSFMFSAMAAPAMAGNVRNASTDSSYDTLDAALEASRPGETLELAAGSYKGNFTIRVPLTLRGIGEGTSKPVLDGDRKGTVLVIAAPGSVVENIAVANSGREPDPFMYWGEAGIRVEADRVTLRDLKVEGNDWGILMMAGEGSVIENSDVAGNLHAGVQVMGGRNHRISGNTVNGNGTGIMVDMLHQERRSLLDRATDPDAVARMAQDQRMSKRSEDIVISDNQVRGNANLGIAAHWYARRITIQSNTVHLTGIERKPDRAMIERVEREITAGLGGQAVAKVRTQEIGTGIHLFCFVEDSTVRSNHSFDNATNGIGMVAVNTNHVSGNDVTGNATGIAIEGSNTNRVEANTVTDNADYGIRVGSPEPMSGQSTGNVLWMNDISGSRTNAYDNSGRGPALGDMEAMIEALPYPDKVKEQMRTNKSVRDMYLKALQDAYKPGSNAWDDGHLGNHYGDFDELPEGFVDHDNDGISEAAHPIPGGSSVDHFPLSAARVTTP